MWIRFAIALLPIIWLIISLGVMRMPAARACVIGLTLTMALAIFSFKLPVLDTMTGALEGIIMGIWPIMFVIVMAFGLEPIRASVISLIANTTATAFGAIGLPIITLGEVTGLKQEELSFIVTL